MIVPIGIATHPYYSKRRFPITMSVTTTMTKKTIKSHKGHSSKYTPPMPAPPAVRQMIVPIELTTYQSLTDERFPDSMNTTTMMTNKRRKSHK